MGKMNPGAPPLNLPIYAFANLPAESKGDATPAFAGLRGLKEENT
jgi:hypothetical protein